MKTYTIIYLHARRMPKVTFKKEYQALTPNIALHLFVNEKKHDKHFVAAIIEGPKSLVHFTEEGK